MAIRFDSSPEYLVRSSSPIDYNSNYTIMGWVNLNATSGQRAVFSINNGAWSSQDLLLVAQSGGAKWSLFIAVTSGTYNFYYSSEVPSTSTWYHVAMVRTSATSFIFYLNGTSIVTGTRDITPRTASTAQHCGIYPDAPWSGQLDGRIAAVKAWTTNLTASQVQQEMNSIRPIFFGSLYGFWPMLPGATERTADYSGNGYNWTEGGTLSDEDPPPVSWGGAPLVFPYVAAAPPGGLSIPVAMYHYSKHLRA